MRALNRCFQEVGTGLPAKETRGIAVAVAHDLDWFIVSNTKEYMRAVTKLTGFTWGQEITLVMRMGVSCSTAVIEASLRAQRSCLAGVASISAFLRNDLLRSERNRNSGRQHVISLPAAR